MPIFEWKFIPYFKIVNQNPLRGRTQSALKMILIGEGEAFFFFALVLRSESCLQVLCSGRKLDKKVSNGLPFQDGMRRVNQLKVP